MKTLKRSEEKMLFRLYFGIVEQLKLAHYFQYGETGEGISTKSLFHELYEVAENLASQGVHT